jgi:hypothetical protein
MPTAAGELMTRDQLGGPLRLFFRRADGKFIMVDHLSLNPVVNPSDKKIMPARQVLSAF